MTVIQTRIKDNPSSFKAEYNKGNHLESFIAHNTL